jgi:nucleoside-triphosphatase THEP1
MEKLRNRKMSETKNNLIVPELSEKWIKASIIGTIWAASEIVLGSFLHNLRIPFSGNILTAIGLIILISISYIWNEKGLFWRAGLICAVMKTMSPSAVIFGPMIAIFSEALLLELFVRLFGRTFAGYAIGAMSAMSWNLFQKIVNYIIFYGSSIIEVYTNLLKLAQKQLNLQTDIVWLPIIILLIIYALFGLFAAVIGIKAGRKMLRQPISDFTGTGNEPIKEIPNSSKHTFNYSVTWLFADIALIICSFILLNYASWIVWSLAITTIIIIWSLRYKRALRQLLKPKFWVFFVFITLITAFVFTKAQTGENLLQKGLLTGFQMNFRAAIMIVGFSVLGTELYNPVIRNFFYKTSFKNLPLALELSAESLPAFITSIPDFKSLLKNPVSIFYQVILQADKRLSEIKNKKNNVFIQKTFIISGSVGEGKTTYTKKLIDFFKKDNIKVGGILSERVMTDSQTTGYDLVNIETGEKEVFLRQDGECGYEKIGKFTICPNGLSMGKAILSSLVLTENRIVIIDEVGLLELRNRGWADSINEILHKSGNHILITVRTSLIDNVIKNWNIKDAIIFDITETDYLTAGASISGLIKMF